MDQSVESSTGRPLRVLVAHPSTGPFPGSVKKISKLLKLMLKSPYVLSTAQKEFKALIFLTIFRTVVYDQFKVENVKRQCNKLVHTCHFCALFHMEKQLGLYM